MFGRQQPTNSLTSTRPDRRRLRNDLDMQLSQQAIRSCIVTGAVGDALGGVAERGSKTLSDDTQLTLATCEAIIVGGRPEPQAIAERMRVWFTAGAVTGLGSSTLKALRDLQAGAHWALAGARGEYAAGNGAAMRAAPLAFFLDPAETADRMRLRDIARITHHHDEAYIGALAVVIALRRAAMALHWSNAAVASELPDSRVRDNLRRSESMNSVEAVVNEVGFSGFVAETVPVALEVARNMQAVGVEAALLELNSLGGDSDTIGSIAGQIVGAATAVDASHLLRDVMGAQKVIDIADRFAQHLDGA
jgi:ADP-ribosyl-[dinitrogen reductase] hydrolase